MNYFQKKSRKCLVKFQFRSSLTQSDDIIESLSEAQKRNRGRTFALHGGAVVVVDVFAGRRRFIDAPVGRGGRRRDGLFDDDGGGGGRRHSIGGGRRRFIGRGRRRFIGSGRRRFIGGDRRRTLHDFRGVCLVPSKILQARFRELITFGLIVCNFASQLRNCIKS